MIKLVVALLLLCGVFFLSAQYVKLQKAHSTFENYYAFRGCKELLEKTETYGICTTSSGQTIKIVKIDGRWFLEGDGPGVW